MRELLFAKNMCIICSPVQLASMAGPRSLADGCASATSLAVRDVDSVMQAVECFMGDIGSVESFAYSRTACVSHPDGLACRCNMEVFLLLPSGGHVLEMTRLTGDSVLFALVVRLLRVFLATGARPVLARGQLFKRCRLTPSMDPRAVPPLELPPAF